MLRMEQSRTLLLYWAAGVVAVLMAGCSREGAKPAVQAPARQIKVVTKKWNIEPGEIKVKVNEPVELLVTTLDVAHGFEVPELRIDEPVNPGPEVKIRLQVGKAGRYTVRCSILCGMGHEDMLGTIVAE